MSPRILRLVVAFIAGFVFLSLMPALPSLVRSLGPLPGADQLGDVLLAGAAALSAVLLLVVIRRRLQKTRQAAVAFSRALARQPGRSVLQTDRRTDGQTHRRTGRTGISKVRAESALEAKIRGAARKGERLASLARRHGMSIDAIRTALGESMSGPAIQPGSSFRTRQQQLPAVPQAKALPRRRTPYGVLT